MTQCFTTENPVLPESLAVLMSHILSSVSEGRASSFLWTRNMSQQLDLSTAPENLRLRNKMTVCTFLMAGKIVLGGQKVMFPGNNSFKNAHNISKRGKSSSLSTKRSLCFLFLSCSKRKGARVCDVPPLCLRACFLDAQHVKKNAKSGTSIFHWELSNLKNKNRLSMKISILSDAYHTSGQKEVWTKTVFTICFFFRYKLSTLLSEKLLQVIF